MGDVTMNQLFREKTSDAFELEEISELSATNAFHNTLDRPSEELVPRTPRPSMKFVLGLGGCYIDHLLNRLGHLLDHKHVWRVSVPSLASSKLRLRSRVLAFKEASDFFARETEKQISDLLAESDADAFIFDVASDFGTDHIAIGNTVFPDFRTGLIGKEWADISFDGIPEMSGYKVLSADTAYYWDMWKFYFNELYSTTLRKKIAAGQKVFILQIFVCELAVDKGVAAPFESLERIRERNARLTEIYEFLASYPGVQLLRIPEKLFYASPYSPWGGTWEFHPEEEFYGIARRELLRALFPGGSQAEDYLCDWLFAAGKERVKAHQEREHAQRSLAELEQGCEAIRGELARAQQALEEQTAARASFEGIAGEATRERDAAKHEAAHLHATLADQTAARAASEATARDAVQNLEIAKSEQAQMQATIAEQAAARNASDAAAADALSELEKARGELTELHARLTELTTGSGMWETAAGDAMRDLEVAKGELIHVRTALAEESAARTSAEAAAMNATQDLESIRVELSQVKSLSRFLKIWPRGKASGERHLNAKQKQAI